MPPPFDLDQRPVAAVFRAPVFNASETFVRGQAAGLAARELAEARFDFARQMRRLEQIYDPVRACRCG